MLALEFESKLSAPPVENVIHLHSGRSVNFQRTTTRTTEQPTISEIFLINRTKKKTRRKTLS